MHAEDEGDEGGDKVGSFVMSNAPYLEPISALISINGTVVSANQEKNVSEQFED